MDAFPDPKVARALLALPECDSVTVDPHKFGYVPVPAGAVLFRDGDVRGVLATPRPYFGRVLDDWQEHPPTSIGGFILEGTRPGAAAAAAWLAHRVVGLHRDGYGSLVASAVSAAREFGAAVEALDGKQVATTSGRSRLRARLLTKPDLNILCFGLKASNERRLDRMNALNRRIFRAFDIERVGTKPGRFVLSSTRLTRAEYGDAPVPFLKSMGIARAEWERTRELFLLRAVVLSPLLVGSGVAEEFGRELEVVTRAAVAHGRPAAKGKARSRSSSRPSRKDK
jgi:hypothetical protein